MKIAVPRERMPGETRVAISPDVVKKLVGLGCEIVVEKGAGDDAAITDAEFKEAGASIGNDEASTLKDADVVLKVQRPVVEGDLNEVAMLKPGCVLIAQLQALTHPDEVAAYAQANINAFALELMPRISRAQSMDILSSQNNLAGYKAVIDGAAEFGSALPMMMTAAGTVPAAKTFIMGVGVAGLQAIATARRLGAVVTATDVRPATKEQVESLGAKFLAVEDDEFRQAQTAGGYAKEMSKEYQAKQAELTASHVAKQDMVITTALIPGRPAPRLITAAMIASMKPGSVIVDLAVERGGNVEGARLGEVVTTANGVKIVGHANVPGRLAATASSLYAKNLFAFLEIMIDKASKALVVPWDDELVKATLLTRDGAVVHPNFQSAAPAAAAPAAEAPAADEPAAKAKAAPKKSTKA